MTFLARPIDIFIGWIKWPFAVTMLLMLPGLCFAAFKLGGEIASNPGPLTAFGVGLGGYWVLWLLVFSKRSIGDIVSTMEHELTHSIFAWMTFHHVSDFKATFNSGGYVQIHGGKGGNWLILIAPYWFPTLTIPVMLILGLHPAAHADTVSCLLGVTFSYQLTSTYLETHRGQTDLQRVSFLFARMVLPSLNIIAAGFVVAVAYGGLDRAMDYLTSSITQVRGVYSVLFEYLGALFQEIAKQL
jgi:hypothetical protein